MTNQQLLYLPGVDGIHDAGERLAEALPSVELLQPEYPSAYSSDLDAMADWIHNEFLKDVTLPLPIIGESFGGALAQCLVERHPACCERLILLSTFTRMPRPRYSRFIASLLSTLPGWMVRLPIQVTARPLILQRTTKEQRRRFYAILKEMRLRDVAKRIRALRRFKGRNLAKRTVTTLWIWGESDSLMNHRDERRYLMAERPQEQAIMIGQAGHVVIRSQAETLVMHVKRFLGLDR